MRIGKYYDEFFNNNYNRDLRCIGKQRNVKHAPKFETTNNKHAKSKRVFIKNNINSTMAKYTNFYGSHTYFEDIIDYQIANEQARTINHFFFDFDKEFPNGSKFKTITKGNGDNILGIEDLKQLPIRDYIDGMKAIQEQIQDMIVYENILKDSWQESKKVYEYFKSQGLTTYTCLSMSKGVHLRCFFKPIHVNNYNRIIHNLHDNLVKQFNLKTLDPQVSGKDSNPSKTVERLPYTYNEKSGLRVIPFNFEYDSLDEVIERTLKISEHKIVNVDEFNLSDYVNPTFHDGILKLNSQIEVLKMKEQQAKDKLLKEKIANGTINGTYTGENALFKDLRILIRFVCGDDNLVSEHDRYDKWKCVFHDDKSPSAIVGIKNYQCLSSNCKVGKINYFEFLRLWFGLDSDDEVKEKMVELQQLYDERIGTGRSLSGGDVEKIMNKIEQEVDA